MKINGEHVDPEILSTEFQRLMQTQADRPAELRLTDERVREIARENVVAGTLLSQEAKKRVPDVAETDIKQRVKQLRKQHGGQLDAVPFDILRPRVENEVRIDRMYRELFKTLPKVTQEQARKQYDKDPSLYNEPEQVHCSHIVRHTFGGADPNESLKQIMEAQDLLRKGAPFEQVSKRFSDQHGQAGDLGTFPRGQMVDKFDNVVFRMQPGRISDVFQTEFGYHIVFLHEKIAEKERSFEEAKDDVIRSLQDTRRREAVDALLEELRAAARIEDDEDEEGGEQNAETIGEE